MVKPFKLIRPNSAPLVLSPVQSIILSKYTADTGRFGVKPGIYEASFTVQIKGKIRVNEDGSIEGNTYAMVLP